MTGVDMSAAKMSRANLVGMLGDPGSDAVALAAALMERAKANQQWCETGAKSGSPAHFDNEDLRPIRTLLKGFKLTAASFKNACLVGLDLSGAALQGANFEGADLRGACLIGADLRGARFVGANLTKADLRKAVLSPLPLGGDRGAPVNLGGARLRYLSAQMGDLTGAVFDDADLRGANFTDAKIDKASWRGASMTSVSGLDFSHAA